MASLRLGVLVFLCVGCFNPEGKQSGDASDTGASSAAASTTGGTGTASTGGTATAPTGGTDTAPTTGMGVTAGGPTTDDATATMDASTTGGAAVCGDSVVQAGEDCDDGNTIGSDKCPAMCRFGCGDGVLDGEEKCDDGNVVDGDGCSSQCVRDALLVFVTDQTFPADLGGLEGADMACQTAATAAGLVGTFRAWLSDDTFPATSRVPSGAMPYVRRDGALVAVNAGAIISGVEEKLKAPISVTELNDELLMLSACGSADAVWTGTSRFGVQIMGANCGNWNDVDSPVDAVGGSLQATNADWTEGCGLACNGGARLYCFEIEG